MGAMWLAQASQERGLPAWWPIAAVLLPLLIALIVALIQVYGSVKAAKIMAASKPPAPEDIAEEVARVLGQELDKRLGPEVVADAQAAFDKGRAEAERAAQEAIEEHRRVIHELQAQLAAKDATPEGAKPEALAAAMLFNSGHDAQQAGNLGEAIGMYSAAIELDPAYAKAYYNRGNAKFDLGDKRGAIEDYDEALRLDSTDAKALYNCANAKADLGDHAGALGDYNECVRLDPKFVHAYYNRGNSKAALGDSAGAVQDFVSALAIDEDYAAAHYNIACEAAKNANALTALKHLGKAIGLDPQWRRRAETDPDFESIRDGEPFKKLLEAV